MPTILEQLNTWAFVGTYLVKLPTTGLLAWNNYGQSHGTAQSADCAVVQGQEELAVRQAGKAG